MCSFFGLEMDSYRGDLTDILRASGTSNTGGGGGGGESDGTEALAAAVSNWEFTCGNSWFEDNNMDNNSSNNNIRDDLFGDPFINMRDPLLHELNNVVASGYFSSPNSTDHHNFLSTSAAAVAATTSASVDDTCNFPGANSTGNIIGHQHHSHKLFEDDRLNHQNINSSNAPCNIFSRIQISPQNNSAPNNKNKFPVSPPCDSPVGFKASPMVSIDMINTNSSKNCLLDNTGPVQISSPRNLGIKRRKSQAKKVVCIPAPAAANSRPSGEVVPSDLWAWRKYGQKPIKGSPYPRGYYRCSSSKGCSARKQVERSRTDPNMLVITYTSEHNHPWPTQRNALAGSTRSQPPKINATSSSSKGSPSSHSQKSPLNTKEEFKESSNNDTLSPPTNNMSTSTSALVKEEIEEKQMDDTDKFSSEGFDHQSSSYRPTMPDSSQSHEDFFSELGEIEADPLDLLFSQAGFSGDHEQKGSKGNSDPFGLFDWSADSNNISFEESKRGL